MGTPSKAKAGRSSIVTIGGVSGLGGTTFTKIGEVMDASFSGSAWSTEDVSNFDSGVDEEFIATMRNNGEISLKYNTIDDDPGQMALEAACDTGSKFDFKVQLAPGPTQATGKLYAFSALILSVMDIPVTTKGVIQTSAKLKVSGSFTKTAGTALTTTALSASVNPAVVGASVVFTATVTSPTTGTVAGTVQFKDGATPLGSPVALSGGGTTTYTTTSLTVGTHPITAVFTPTGTTYGASTSPVVNEVITSS